MNNDLMFSSKTGKWDTPQSLVDDLATVFPWDLDVCASRPNVCDNYYDEADNSILQTWRGLCWMNPPYGDPVKVCKRGCTRKLCQRRGFHDYENYKEGIVDWVRISRVTSEMCRGTSVVCLVPSRTDTHWWHDNVPDASQVVFIKGRLKFGTATNSAPFPSAFVVFGDINDEQRAKLASYGWDVGL